MYENLFQKLNVTLTLQTGGGQYPGDQESLSYQFKLVDVEWNTIHYQD